jgi:hypothetical protein
VVTGLTPVLPRGQTFSKASIIFVYCHTKGREVTDSSTDSELVNDLGEPRNGSMDSYEILTGLVQALYPRKPYCLVDAWTILKIDVSEDELTKIQAAGQMPLIVFARNVRFDSERRFDVGDWVRTTLATSFEEGFLFETRNTIYVLCGDGHEKATSLKTALSFF